MLWVTLLPDIAVSHRTSKCGSLLGSSLAMGIVDSDVADATFICHLAAACMFALQRWAHKVIIALIL